MEEQDSDHLTYRCMRTRLW